MIVRIDKNVHVQIAEFYAISMALHPTLDEVTVEKKKSRLYEAIRALEKYATIYPNARYKQAWIDAGYKEFIAHSLLYHN